MQDVYEHLAAYGLDSTGDVHSRLGKLSDSRLVSFLEEYMELARKRALAIRASRTATDIYPDSHGGTIPLNLIRQLAIYANRIYVHDPLIGHHEEWGYVESPPPDVLFECPERDQRVDLYRRRLASTIYGILLLKPLVESGVIHLVPRELVEPKREVWALYAD